MLCIFLKSIIEKKMDIKCIFYSEFDINTGPILSHQVPQE